MKVFTREAVGRRALAGAALSLALLPHVAGQQPAPAPAGQDEEVVRITSNLIQVDAVVLDAEGRQVTDLAPEDFELLEVVDPATGLPRLQTQVRLFKDGKVAYEGKVAPFETAQREDLGRLRAGGQIALSRAAAPGEYVLQIIVTDPLAKEDRRVATRWIDFEIVR